MHTLADLSIDPLSIITQFLEPIEVLSIQHTCRQLYNVLSADNVWVECLNRNNNIRKLAIRDQIKRTCPDIIIVRCSYARYIMKNPQHLERFKNDDFRGDDFCIIRISNENIDLPCILNEDKNKLYERLDIDEELGANIVLHNKKGCREYSYDENDEYNDLSQCVCEIRFKCFIQYKLQLKYFKCIDYPYQVDYAFKNGMYYAVVHCNRDYSVM